MSNSDYEGMADGTFTDCSDKKRTPKFVGETQAMVDNNLSKLIRSTGVSEFLIRQVVHEDICYFSYKMKGQFLSQAMKDKKIRLQSF